MGFKHLTGRSISGTCFMGRIEATEAQLLRTFGPPDELNGDKTTMEWDLEFDNGVIATIYDYRGDRWHVGGFDPAAVDMVKESLSVTEKLPCLDAAEGGCGWPNLCDNCKANAKGTK